MDNLPVQLVEVATAHVPQMMTWFPTEHSCRVWGGPEFRFPFTPETFLADSKLTSLPTYALLLGKKLELGVGSLRGGSSLGRSEQRRLPCPMSMVS